MNTGATPAPGPSQWLLPNGVIDSRPNFTPNLYRNWRREVKLWKSAQIGANLTQLISKMVATLPTNSRVGVHHIWEIRKIARKHGL